MFKAEEFKEWIGFDHTWLVIITTIVTGLSFPFIFLGENLTSFSFKAMYNVPVGIIYASILEFGNLYIFYRFKKKQEKLLRENPWEKFHMNIFVHISFTLVASFLLSTAILLEAPSEFTTEYVIRNLIGSMLLVTILVGFYETSFYMMAFKKSIQREAQLKKENVESQLEILKNQVKPHFLFNSLNTLTSLIPENPNEAVAYVQKLSKVYRYILEIKDKRLIPLQDELDCIKDYVYMLQIRFGENLQFELDESGLDFRHHVVPLSLQLVVENAVKHNVISTKRPLRINIKKGKNGSLLISNNLQAKLDSSPSTGIGLKNIRSRYEIISSKEVDVIVTDKHFTVALPLIEVK